MRRILITTPNPDRHDGYMVVKGSKPGAVRLRLECDHIDDNDAQFRRRMYLAAIDPDATIEISEVR